MIKHGWSAKSYAAYWSSNKNVVQNRAKSGNLLQGGQNPLPTWNTVKRSAAPISLITMVYLKRNSSTLRKPCRIHIFGLIVAALISSFRTGSDWSVTISILYSMKPKEPDESHPWKILISARTPPNDAQIASLVTRPILDILEISKLLAGNTPLFLE